MAEALDPRDRGPELAELALEHLDPRRRRRVVLVLRQAEAHHVDPAAGNRARHQGDRIKRQGRTFPGRVVKVDVEIIRQRQPLLAGIDLDAVDSGELEQRVLAGHGEIAKQMRIGRRTRLHVDEEAIERLCALRWRQEIDVIARRDRVGFDQDGINPRLKNKLFERTG